MTLKASTQSRRKKKSRMLGWEHRLPVPVVAGGHHVQQLGRQSFVFHYKYQYGFLVRQILLVVSSKRLGGNIGCQYQLLVVVITFSSLGISRLSTSTSTSLDFWFAKSFSWSAQQWGGGRGAEFSLSTSAT